MFILWDDFGRWILLPYLDVKETSSTVDSNDSGWHFFEGFNAKNIQ